MSVDKSLLHRLLEALRDWQTVAKMKWLYRLGHDRALWEALDPESLGGPRWLVEAHDGNEELIGQGIIAEADLREKQNQRSQAVEKARKALVTLDTEGERGESLLEALDVDSSSLGDFLRHEKNGTATIALATDAERAIRKALARSNANKGMAQVEQAEGTGVGSNQAESEQGSPLWCLDSLITRLKDDAMAEMSAPVPERRQVHMRRLENAQQHYQEIQELYLRCRRQCAATPLPPSCDYHTILQEAKSLALDLLHFRSDDPTTTSQTRGAEHNRFSDLIWRYRTVGDGLLNLRTSCGGQSLTGTHFPRPVRAEKAAGTGVGRDPAEGKQAEGIDGAGRSESKGRNLRSSPNPSPSSEDTALARLQGMAKLSAEGGRVTERAILAALHRLENATSAEATSAWELLYSRMKEIAGWQPPEQVDPPDRSIDADEDGNIFDQITFDVRCFPPGIEQLWTQNTWPALRDILNRLPRAEATDTERAEGTSPASDPAGTEPSEGADAAGGRGKRASPIPTDEANGIVRNYIARRERAGQKCTARGVADDCGIALGRVSALLAWQAYQARRKSGQPSRKPKEARQVTEKMLACIGEDDDPSARMSAEEAAWRTLLERASTEERARLNAMNAAEKAEAIQLVIDQFADQDE
jgi:hypothetical protein